VIVEKVEKFFGRVKRFLGLSRFRRREIIDLKDIGRCSN
jgi:hypothetical protein